MALIFVLLLTAILFKDILNKNHLNAQRPGFTLFDVWVMRDIFGRCRSDYLESQSEKYEVEIGLYCIIQYNI